MAGLVSAATRFAAVVPAAGRSERMGLDKLLLPWRHTVVLGSVIEALEAGGSDRVVVVCAPGNRALRNWLEEAGHPPAVNHQPERGMLSSVLEGIAALGGVDRLAATFAGLLVCPGDHAGLEPSTVASLHAALGRAPLAVPAHGGSRGHPLAIGASLVQEIPHLSAGVGLRELVEHHLEDLEEVPVDDAAVIRDLDTPSDYRAAVEHG